MAHPASTSRFPALYLITDGGGNGSDRLMDGVEKALDGGLRFLQLREKALETGELYRLAEKLRKLTERYGALLIVNERLDVALASGADGAHVGSLGIPPAAARALGPPPFLLGVSTHSTGELRAAVAAGADFVTFGPVYDTASKSAYGPPVGLEALGEAVRTVSVPVFGLGGIVRERVKEVLNAGAAGVALISAVWSAPDIRGETRALLEALSRGEP